LMQNGIVKTLDEQAVVEKAEKHAFKLLARNL